MPIRQQVEKEVNRPEGTGRAASPYPVYIHPDRMDDTRESPPEPETELTPLPEPYFTVTLPVATRECDPRKFITAPPAIHTLMPGYYGAHRAEEHATYSMHGFPKSVLHAVERVGVLSYTTTKARFGPVVGCMFESALKAWKQHGIIGKAIEVNTGFKAVDKNRYSKVQSAMISAFFTDNKPGAVTVAGGGSRRNAIIPKSIRDKMSALAGDAGVDVGAFGIISLMAILCREDCTLPELATEYAGQVANFLETMRERAVGQEALMLAYGRRPR